MASLFDLLKRRFAGTLSSERITPERPNFTGTAGVAKFDSEIGPMGAVIGAGLVDPHLAAAAGGPGWGSGMAPSTMTKVPASAGSSKWKKVIEQLGKMTGPEPDWGLAGQRVGPASAWAHTNIPYAETAGLMGFRKKKEGPY